MSVIAIKGTERFVVATGLSLREAKDVKKELLNELQTFYIIRICIK